MAKKKILLLSDDLRMASGVANVSKQLVLGTVDTYDWVQLGAAINHPEVGKVFDLNDDVRQRTGVADASVKIYPSNGYGSQEAIRQLLMIEKPDAILHFTDPRYWIWLYEMEHEIRQSVPLFFYHIWDDLPDPKYNRDYYESCDWIGCISKQTYGITKRVWGWDKEKHWRKPEDWQVSYVPHGINPDLYKPVEVPAEFKKRIFGDKTYEFVIYWTNRNIRRKQPIDLMLAFEQFRQSLPKEKQDTVALVMKTNPIEEHGTDLIRTAEHLMPNANIIFVNEKLVEEELNYLYNMADITVMVSSNEGFGLGTAESLMAGTPIITTVTGGLQDQCGFRDKVTGKLLTAEDYVGIGSLHYRGFKNTHIWGDWVKPLWPVRSTTGSIPTPYIFDDRIDYEDASFAIREWYDTPKENRKAAGLKARNWMLGDGMLSTAAMCKSLVDGMEGAFANWKPRHKFDLIKI